MRRFVIVSPVKDEAPLLEHTLRSVVAQTARPVLWIIVDDGSRDSTLDLVQRYSREHQWIKFCTTYRRTERLPGNPVVQAFNTGMKMIGDLQYDFIVKLDGDLVLPADYFERVLSQFDQDPKLGIASGVYFESQHGQWREVRMPPYHAAGASKVLRAACFDEIGGFVASQGWDTVDEIRAQTRGWRTAHFRDIQFQHLKKEGSSIGPLRTSFMHGRVYYLTGGGAGFLFLKSVSRAFTTHPLFLSAGAMLAGFLYSRLSGGDRLVSEIEAQHYRGVLNQRITRAVSQLFAQLANRRLWGHL
jgi:biofilm PGA synthesis N-glycosyltransferase PgaC